MAWKFGLEDAVWEAVKGALQNPQLLMEEYTRRVEEMSAPNGLKFESKRLTSGLNKLRSQEERLTDAYLNEAMDLEQYKTKMDQVAAHRHDLERLSLEVKDQAQQEVNNRQGLERLNEFCDRVSRGLGNLSFEDRQRFLRLVVDSIVVEDGRVKVDTIMPPDHDGALRNIRGELVEPSVREMAFDEPTTNGRH